MTTVTNIGSANGTAATLSVTVNTTIPVGSIVFVIAAWTATANPGTCSDTQGNVYGAIAGPVANNNVGANGALAIYTAPVTTALVNTNTISFARNASAVTSTIDVFWVSGLQGNTSDGASSGATFGSSTSPSVTSGSPAQGLELFVAAVSGATAVASFTQDTSNASWGTSAPAGGISIAAPVMGVGFVINGGVGTLTYNPTYGTSDAWAAIILGFVPAKTPWNPSTQLSPTLAQ